MKFPFLTVAFILIIGSSIVGFNAIYLNDWFVGLISGFLISVGIVFSKKLAKYISIAGFVLLFSVVILDISNTSSSAKMVFNGCAIGVMAGALIMIYVTWPNSAYLLYKYAKHDGFSKLAEYFYMFTDRKDKD